MITIARIEDLEDRRPAIANVGDVELVILRIGDEVSVLQGTCPHRGTSLSTGSVGGTALTCPSHGWCFDARTGERLDRPGRSLHRFDCKRSDGEVRINPDEVRRFANASVQLSPHAEKGGARPMDSLPGPRALPLVGNLLSIRPKKIHRRLRELGEIYGTTYKIQMPGLGKAVVFTDPNTLRDILKDRPGTFRRMSTIEPLLMEAGAHGLFSHEGASWKRQRRLVTPSFNMGQLQSFHATMKTVLGRLKKRWEKAAREGTALHVQDEMSRFAVDVTTNFACGHDPNTIEGQTGNLRDHLSVILPRVGARLLAPIPYWRHFKLAADHACDRAMDQARVLVQEMVERARSEMAGKDPREARTFLESLVIAEDDDGEKLSDDEVFGNVFTMLLGGEDTTAHTLTWIVHFITEHPKVQERMSEEADAVVQSDFVERLADYERLRYIDAVTTEAMRLRPVAPMILVEPVTNVEVEGVAIPKGTVCVLLTSLPGLRREQFANPDRFDPDRWISGNGPRDALLPFGYGPRHCPGRNFSLFEIKAVLALLSKHFVVAKTLGHPPVDDVYGFVLHATPITVNLSARSA